MKKNSDGFAAVEWLICIVIAISIGLVGYKVLHKPNKVTKESPVTTTTNAQQSIATDKKNETNDAAASNAEKEAAALALVKKVYDPYVNMKDEAPGNISNIAKANSTDALVAKVNSEKGFDGYLCAQNTPASLKYGTSTTDGNLVTVQVSEIFGSDQKDIKVVVDASIGKLSDVVCLN